MFRELLLVASGKLPALSRVPDENEWEFMYSEAVSQGIQGLMWNAVCSLPGEQRPARVLTERWSREAQTLAIVGDVQDGACASLTSWLDDRGLQSCILKGRAYAGFYPKGAARLSGDIDVWVCADRSSTLSAFRSAGVPVSSILWQECKVKFFPDIILDVHFRPLRFFNPLFGRRFSSVCKEEAAAGFRMCDRGFGIPSDRFSAVFCTAHIFLHSVSGGIGLRQLADLSFILERLSDEDRAWAFGCLRRIGLANFASSLMRILSDVFALEKSHLLCEPDCSSLESVMRKVSLTGGYLSRPDEGSRIRNSFSHTLGSLKFVFMYPRHLAWIPIYKIWHFAWRGVHNCL